MHWHAITVSICTSFVTIALCYLFPVFLKPFREINKRLTEEQATLEFQKALKLEADFSEYFTGMF